MGPVKTREEQRVFDRAVVDIERRQAGLRPIDEGTTLEDLRKAKKLATKTTKLGFKVLPLVISIVILSIEVLRLVLAYTGITEENKAVLLTSSIFQGIAVVAQVFIIIRILALRSGPRKESSFITNSLGWIIAIYQSYSALRPIIDRTVLKSEIITELVEKIPSSEGFETIVVKKKKPKRKRNRGELMKNRDTGFTDRQTEFFLHAQDRARVRDYNRPRVPKFSPDRLSARPSLSA